LRLARNDGASEQQARGERDAGEDSYRSNDFRGRELHGDIVDRPAQAGDRTIVSMMPGAPHLTEAEYWRDYDIIRNEANAAMVSCYTHRAINHIAATEPEIAAKMNYNADFWRITSFSLQTTMFIVLARILDSDGSVHSIHKVLSATTAHPEFFSREALRERKLNIPGAKWNPGQLEEYVRDVAEPTREELRRLKKALAPHKAKFDEICKPLRDQIFAHTIAKDEVLIADLFSKALKSDIDQILCFLHSLIEAIKYLALNAMPPELGGDHYGYAARVKEITNRTERLLKQLP
jgi:hypothetical protein